MGSNYETKWQEYSQLRRLYVLVFGGFVVSALIVAAVSNYYTVGSASIRTADARQLHSKDHA